MNLYFLRHAIAVERGTPGYESDSERPLTAKGASRMRKIAEGMKSLELEYDLILTSPYVRARSTAEIVADVFKCKKRLRITRNLVNGDDAALIGELTDSYGKNREILLVGHEPHMSHLISVLLTGSENSDIIMKKGGLCKLSIPELRYERCATLEWLLTPRVLVGLG